MSASIRKICKTIFLILTSLAFLFPLLWIIQISLKTNTQVFTDPFALPLPPQWVNYYHAFQTIDFFTLFKNTFFVTVASISVGIALAVLASFAIARMRFGSGRLQRFFYNYYVLGMLIPTFILLYPLFRMSVALGTNNTLWSVILPYWGFTAPLHSMIFVTAFKGIPTELDEAAAIDGCGCFRILLTVDLPLIKPAIATSMIIAILGCWNEYPLSSVMLISNDLWTLSLAASKFQGLYSANYAEMAAAIVILTIPQLIIFAFFQKQIQDGVVSGAVKG